ncbi:PH domain-containing protein [Candidatus Micrarchaeota archaeon]|nr:PH domain-containing protein [Candidatus Micrarchaeota archaeon]
MAELETYRLSPKVKLLWFAPYISGIVILWLILSAVYLTVLSDKSVLWLKPELPKYLGVISLLLVILIIVGLPGYLWVNAYYKSFTYTLTDTEIVIKNGIFKINRITIPYDSIENTAVKRDFVAQLLGIGTVVIDTAGGDEKEGIIPGVTDPDQVVEDIIAHIKEVRGSGEMRQRETMNELLRDIKNELVDIKKLVSENIERLSKKKRRKKKDESFEDIMKKTLSKRKD